MKKRIVYKDHSDFPNLKDVQIVEDFLPVSEKFRKGKAIIRVTVEVEEKKLENLRRFSQKKNATYDQLIYQAVDEYIARHA